MVNADLVFLYDQAMCLVSDDKQNYRPSDSSGHACNDGDFFLFMPSRYDLTGGDCWT